MLVGSLLGTLQYLWELDMENEKNEKKNSKNLKKINNIVIFDKKVVKTKH